MCITNARNPKSSRIAMWQALVRFSVTKADCNRRILGQQEGEEKDVLIDNHYRKIYKEITPQPLVSKEHTAQLKSAEAAQVQKQFH
jgi:hypothetical protein